MSIIIKIELKKIKPNPYRDFDLHPIKEDTLNELVSSIEEGDLENKHFLVRKVEDGYELVHGHHRFAALQQLKQKYLEAEVIEADDDDMVLRMVRENAYQTGQSLPATLDLVAAIARRAYHALLTSEWGDKHLGTIVPTLFNDDNDI